MLFSILLSTSLFAAEPHEICQKWFFSSGIKQNKECESNCTINKVDMATYMCPNQCEKLCKIKAKKEPEISTNFYGLTNDEIKLCQENPIICAAAYQSTWEADKSCLKIFPNSKTNDESDACRHFIWAGLLTKEHGSEMAKKILDAHENNPKEPLEEKAMDLANNRAGIFASEALIKDNKFDDNALLNEFKRQLKNNSLIVIKPRSKKLNLETQ
jgi:hypothetical protein